LDKKNYKNNSTEISILKLCNLWDMNKKQRTNEIGSSLLSSHEGKVHPVASNEGPEREKLWHWMEVEG
jgi:hypothetical protein